MERDDRNAELLLLGIKRSAQRMVDEIASLANKAAARGDRGTGQVIDTYFLSAKQLLRSIKEENSLSASSDRTIRALNGINKLRDETIIFASEAGLAVPWREYDIRDMKAMLEADEAAGLIRQGLDRRDELTSPTLNLSAPAVSFTPSTKNELTAGDLDRIAKQVDEADALANVKAVERMTRKLLEAESNYFIYPKTVQSVPRVPPKFGAEAPSAPAPSPKTPRATGARKYRPESES